MSRATKKTSANAAPSMKLAAVIQFGSKYMTILVQLVITAILSRLLTPEVFGQVAIVTVFTSFFTLFSDMGISTAIVQFEELTKEDFNRLFSFSILMACGLAGLFCIAAWPLAWLYEDDGLVPLFLCAAPVLLFNTLNMVPNGIMLRRRDFRSIGVRLVATTFASGVIAVLMAFAGMGAYALVLQTVMQSLFVFVWNFVASPIRRLDWHFMKPLRLIFSFSSFQLGFNMLDYFTRNLDNLCVGKVFGSAPLGYYDKAYKLTMYPLTAFSSVIASVIQPYMSRYQDNREVIWDFWRRIIKFISLVGAVIAAVLVACSEEVVILFYGSQWQASVPLFAVLSASIYPRLLESTTGGFYQSLGHTDLLFKYGMINTGCTVALLVVGLLSDQLQMVANCMAVAFILKTFITFWGLITKGFKKSYGNIHMFLPEVLAGVGACFVATRVGGLVGGNLWVSLIAKVAVICAIMLAVYALTGQLRYLNVLTRGRAAA